MRFISKCLLVFLLLPTIGNAQSIVINEIMYAPISPEPEWIELYNPSSIDVSTKGWTISDAVKTVKLPENTIKTKGYLILTKDTAGLIQKYQLAGSTFIQVTLPTFNNDEDDCMLKDSNAKIIDSIHYTNKWGGAGGRSLERIDFGYKSDSSNFGSSVAPLGATPVSENSIRRRENDIAALYLVRSSQSNESLDLKATIVNKGRQPISAASINLFSSTSALPIVHYDLTTTLQPKDSVVIDLKWEMADYGSDSLILITTAPNDEFRMNDTQRVTIDFPAPAQAIVINEIMNDPLSSSCEWIELYNQSEHNIQLGGCLVKTFSPPSTIRGYTLPQYILGPKQYVIISANENILPTYPELRTIEGVLSLKKTDINLNANDGFIKLHNADQSLIDSVYYKSTWRENSSSIGVSLERRVPANSSTDDKNWGVCLADKGATPLARNSLNTDSLKLTTAVHIDVKPNPFSPDGDGFDDETNIEIAIPSETEHRISAKLYDLKSRLVATIASDKRMIGTASIPFDGKDNDGRVLPMGLYTLIISSDDNTFTTVRKGLVIAKRKQ